MKSFRKFAILSTVLTYVLIFIGGLVRVAGAGMGCPDWPKCFGRWIPPLSINQVPNHIDPSQFNIVLAWIEYCNRLFGAIVGISIMVTLYYGVKYYGKYPKVKWSIIIAFLLTLFQGWLGSVLVKTVLNPITITLHLLFALIIVMLLIYASQQSYYLEYTEEEKISRYPPNMGAIFNIMAALLLIEVILGTEIRGGLEMIRKENPMIESEFLLKMLGPFKYAHSIIGVTLTLISGYVWYKLVKSSINPSSLIVNASTILCVLIFLQIVTGEVLVFLDFKPLIQLSHLWIASGILGLVTFQYCAWRRSFEFHEQE